MTFSKCDLVVPDVLVTARRKLRFTSVADLDSPCKDLQDQTIASGGSLYLVFTEERDFSVLVWRSYNSRISLAANSLPLTGAL